MSRLFPELDRNIIIHVLRNGVRVKAEEMATCDAINLLRDLGIIKIRERIYTKCTHENDFDFTDREVLDCEGEIELDPEEEDHYCPECGRPIVDIGRKKAFVEFEVEIDANGVKGYLEAVLQSLNIVHTVEQVGLMAFSVALTNKHCLTVVVPNYASAQHHSAGLFFAEPTLYIIVSSIYEPCKTVLEESQYLHLADLLSNPMTLIEDKIDKAAIPVSGRKSFSEIETRFDLMLSKQGDRAWQFFEQEFVPELVLHITENPELAQKYLDSLKRLSGTIFGEYYVPIGGAGLTDLRPIDKYSLMDELFRGHFTGDAKCYKSATLSYDDVTKIHLQLDTDPTEAAMAVIYLSSNDVASTAWDTVMKLKQRYGRWKMIVLTKYLLLELITMLDAVHLLER